MALVQFQPNMRDEGMPKESAVSLATAITERVWFIAENKSPFLSPSNSSRGKRKTIGTSLLGHSITPI